MIDNPLVFASKSHDEGEINEMTGENNPTTEKPPLKDNESFFMSLYVHKFIIHTIHKYIYTSTYLVEIPD